MPRFGTCFRARFEEQGQPARQIPFLLNIFPERMVVDLGFDHGVGEPTYHERRPNTPDHTMITQLQGHARTETDENGILIFCQDKYRQWVLDKLQWFKGRMDSRPEAQQETILEEADNCSLPDESAFNTMFPGEAHP
jgi:hypothetical protein